MAAQVGPTLTRWFTPAGLAVNDWGVRYARERVLRNDVTDWAGAWRAFVDFPVRERFAALTMPALVLAGGADVSTGPELMRGIADRLPNATFRELPGAPHMLTLEAADQVEPALNDFLPTM
jgi:3-oxoadipate enol-lactonase